MVQLTRKYDTAMAAESGDAGEAPPSSAERMKTLRAYTGAVSLPNMQMPQPAPQLKTKPIAKAEAKAKPAAKRAAKPTVKSGPREMPSAKKQPQTSRREFVKTHRPRRHATGPEPMLTSYETDIRKMLKKGYSAADIYHWLHDYRFEEISRRTVQRFVKTVRTDG